MNSNNLKDLSIHQHKKIVFFDGVCNVCNGSVNFIMKYNNDIQFASLQSDFSNNFSNEIKLSAQSLNSIIFYRDNAYFYKSEAVFEIAKLCNHFMCKFLRLFRFLPTKVTDLAYDVIAKYRYTLFGKKDHCRIPTIEERNRFLD